MRETSAGMTAGRLEIGSRDVGGSHRGAGVRLESAARVVGASPCTCLALDAREPAVHVHVVDVVVALACLHPGRAALVIVHTPWR